MDTLNFELDSKGDEDFFGNLARRTNLEQIFGSTVNNVDIQETLKYQPAKIPKTTNTPASTSSSSSATQRHQNTWATQMARVANAYKDGESVGKVGVALLQNDTGVCKILVYKTKKNVLTAFTLTCDAEPSGLHRQARYLQFYDEKRNCWSLLFDKECDEEEFVAKLIELGVKIEENISENAESDGSSSEDKADKMVPTIEAIEIVEHSSTAMTENRKHSKSSIITRMARVGQQLPSFTKTHDSCGIAAACSDSSDTEVINTPMVLNKSNKPPIIPRSNKLQTKTQIVATNHSAGVNTLTPVVNPIETQVLQMLFSENRSQNCELRMNLGRLENKIERVLDRMEVMNGDQKQKSNKDDEILDMEEKILELKKENRRLRQALEATVQHNDDVNVERLFKVYKVDLEMVGITTNNGLESVLSALLEKTQNMQNTCERNDMRVAELQKSLKKSEIQLKEANGQHAKDLEKYNDLEKKVKELQYTLKVHYEEHADLLRKCTEEKETYANDVKCFKKKSEDTLKMIMNNLYININTNIEKMETTDREDIQAIIGLTIREETLRALEQLKQTND